MNELDRKLAETGRRSLLGMAIQRYDTAFVEVAADLGFDALWIEMEHEAISLEQAGDLCRIATGLGLLTMIRVPDPSRQSVLRAAELGPGILDLPMANSVETAVEFVRHARFAPLGTRGFFGSSRAMRYGIGAPPQRQQEKLNDELCLLIQVETREAVACAPALCLVEGIDGIFLGPGDLSSSLGVTGETSHPVVREAMLKTLRTAKTSGKRVAAACAPAEFAYWSEQGIDLMFCASNLSCQIDGARMVLDRAGYSPARPSSTGSSTA